MIRSRVAALFALGSLILAVAGQSTAQIRYVDEKGNSHYVQNENMVPEQYRDKAAKPANLPVILRGDGSATRGLNNMADRADQEDRREAAAQKAKEACLKKMDSRTWDGAIAGRKLGLSESQNMLSQIVDEDRRKCGAEPVHLGR